MEFRSLGSTGVRVSPLCLGAMMFGAWGNTDHDESIRIIHRALDAGINFIDTADVYSRGESEEIVGKALAGGRRDDVVLATKVHGAMGDDPNQFGNSRRWIIREVENSCGGCRPTGSTSTRSTGRTRHRDRGDARRADAISSRRQGSLHRLLDVPGLARSSRRSGSREKRGLERFVCEQPPYSMLVRGIEADVLPTCAALRHGGDPVEPARERLADRAAIAMARSAGVDALRPDAARAMTCRSRATSANSKRPMRSAEIADEAGHLADRDGDRVCDQPSGGHRGDHWPADDGASRVQFPAADVTLSDDVLDAIDEIVPPGDHVSAADGGWAESWAGAKHAAPLTL